MQGAREMLSRLRDIPVERTWKILAEGVLLEARAGRLEVARRASRFLRTVVRWHGPVYHDAVKLEERALQYPRALEIAEQ
jgi:hypothetical protein